MVAPTGNALVTCQAWEPSGEEPSVFTPGNHKAEWREPLCPCHHQPHPRCPMFSLWLVWGFGTIDQGAEIEVRCVQSGPPSRILMLQPRFKFFEFYVVVFLEILTCDRAVPFFCERVISQILWICTSVQFCHRWTVVAGRMYAEGGRFCSSGGTQSDSLASKHLLQNTFWNILG